MPDPGFVLMLVFSAGLTVLGLTAYYGVVLDDNRWVNEYRRVLAWQLTRFPWPAATTPASFLPAGLGFGLAMIGRQVADDTVSLAGFPWNLGQDLMLMGIALIGVALWFMVYPPKRVLAAWHRETLERRRAGLPPTLPEPRHRGELTMTRRQFRFFTAAMLAIIAGAWIFDWPARLPASAFMGLAALGAYRIRQR